MRILLCACLVLAGCGGSGEMVVPVQDDQPSPTAAQIAERAELEQVSEISSRSSKEVDRLIAEGKAAGIEAEVQAAIGRLNQAGNARIFAEGQLSTAQWYEQQVTGKTPAEFLAAFPEK